MNKHTEESVDDLGTLVDQGKELAEHVRDQAVSRAKAAHKAIQESPYKAIGIAALAGVLIGFFLARRGRND